jgi:hypothetical protein
MGPLEYLFPLNGRVGLIDSGHDLFEIDVGQQFLEMGISCFEVSGVIGVHDFRFSAHTHELAKRIDEVFCGARLYNLKMD